MTMAADKQDKVLNVPTLRFPEFTGEWAESTIGEEFELYSGNTPSRLDKENFVGNVNWITSGELKDHYIGDTKEKISESSAKENNLRLMPEGTFVIAIYGLEAEGVRSTGSIITKQSTISQACMAFTPKGDISNEFLYSWYKKHGNVIGIRYAQGTKQQNLSYDIIEKFKIRYPSLKEQDKLNSFISLLDTRIATQIRIIEKTKSLIKGLANLIMDNPSDCIKYLLGDLCEIKSGYSGNQLVGNNGLRVSRIETISNHHINLDRVGFVAPFEKSEEYKLNIGDILFSNINSVEYIGNTAYIDKDYSLYHGMNLLRLIPQKPIVSPFFLYCLLNTDRLKNHFKTICNKAVSQASINQAELSKTPLLLPDMPKQIQIANLFKLLLGKKEIELSYYTCLIKQKKYLLSKLFI